MTKISIIKYSGFTLIELLVVISIIGFLATLALVSLNVARIKARDARRRADITQISKALEIYFDAHGAYPSEDYCDSSIGSCNAACGTCGGSDWSYTSSIGKALKDDKIMLILPKDPKNDTAHFYSYEPSCSQPPCPSGCCYYEIIAIGLEGGGNFVKTGGGP